MLYKINEGTLQQIVRFIWIVINIYAELTHFVFLNFKLFVKFNNDCNLKWETKIWNSHGLKVK